MMRAGALAEWRRGIRDSGVTAQLSRWLEQAKQTGVHIPTFLSGRRGVQRRLDYYASQRIIALMMFVDQILARTLAALTALALVAPSAPASNSAELLAGSGETACCVGSLADTEAAQCGIANGEPPAGGPCVIVCAGAVVVYPPSTRASLRYATPYMRVARLIGHHAPPDPFPPNIPTAA